MLTGDKQETAVNISHSCGHIQTGMKLMYIVQKTTVVDVQAVLDECTKQYVLPINDLI